MLNKKRCLTAVGALILAMSMVGCGAAGTSNTGNTAANATASGQMPTEPTYTGPIVAAYQGGELTKQELDKQYNLQVVLPGLEQQESKKAFLTYYIVWYKYLYGQAVKDPTFKYSAQGAQTMADQSIQQLVGTPYKTADDVKAKMKQLGLTENDMLLLAAKGEALKNYLTNEMKSVQVTDASAQQYYDAHKSDFIQVTVDHVLVSTQDQAKKVESELKAGADFAKTADKYSIDPGVKQNHGTYADQLASSFVPEFAKAAETLPIGQISDPVHTQFGYHVMRVDKRTQLTFDQAKDQIQKQLLPQLQNQKEQDIYSTATKSANIQMKVKEADL